MSANAKWYQAVILDLALNHMLSLNPMVQGMNDPDVTDGVRHHESPFPILSQNTKL
jgi:hypothetical protein